MRKEKRTRVKSCRKGIEEVDGDRIRKEKETKDERIEQDKKMFMHT